MLCLPRCLPAIVAFILPPVPLVAADELDLPPEKIAAGAPGEMMHGYLLRQVDQAAARWNEDYEKRKMPQQIADYQRRMRERCLESIGGLPRRTPLEARITGTVSRPGYRVEKALFQSQPKHYVTALLFLPDGGRFQPPYPGVLAPCGHSFEAKGRAEYQTMGALLALNGMAALVFDPIDQGERGQFLGPGGWPELWGTKAHSMVGVGCILLGRNTARFEIWDGIRAIDYLQSRPEVDLKKIGCTGCSGGGTQTSYLMALDDRIRAAAPSCYLTSFPRLLATIGPQDAEQNIFGQLAFGPYQADWIMIRAPVPVLVLAASRDFFDIGGTWDTFRRAKRLYTRMGLAANLNILESDTKHGFNPLHREGAARWMARWLLDKDQPVVEPKIELLSEEEYRCLPDGKVMSLPGARSVYDLNEDFENELAPRRAAAWAQEDKTALLDRVRQLAGVRKLSELPQPEVELVETAATAPKMETDPCSRRKRGRRRHTPRYREHRDSSPGYRVEKLLIRPEEGVTLPALLFLPEGPASDRVVLYVHERGKSADAGPEGPIEKRVASGEAVLAVDLRGTGQTAPLGKGYYSPQWRDASLAYLLGRSYVGMRGEDVLVCARYAAERFAAGQPGTVDLVAVGSVGVPALHAAALEPQLFGSVRIRRSLRAWADVIHQRLSRDQMVNAVHGALTHYDLPDLAATLGEKLSIEEPADAMGNAARAAAENNHEP